MYYSVYIVYQPSAKFGWLPLRDVAAVTKPRRETAEICWGAPNWQTDLSHSWADVRHIVRTCGGDIAVQQVFSDCRYVS